MQFNHIVDINISGKQTYFYSVINFIVIVTYTPALVYEVHR